MAPSGPPALARRKSAVAAAASSSQSSPTARTRIIYREAKPSYGSESPFWLQGWFICLLFLMAIGFFALAVFLFLGLDMDQGSPSPSYAAASEGVEVRINLHLHAYSSFQTPFSLTCSYGLPTKLENFTYLRCHDTCYRKMLVDCRAQWKVRLN